MQNHLLNGVVMTALVRSSVGECREPLGFSVPLYDDAISKPTFVPRARTRADRRLAVSILHLKMELICVHYFPNSNEGHGNKNLRSDYKMTNATAGRTQTTLM